MYGYNAGPLVVIPIYTVLRYCVILICDQLTELLVFPAPALAVSLPEPAALPVETKGSKEKGS